MTVVKHVNCLPANFNFHRDPWPGYPKARGRIIAALSEVFEWTPTQLKWFLDSVNILWELFYSTKPTGEKNVYYNYICRKAKIIGIVPFRLFQGVHLEDNLAESGAAIYTKDVLPENVTRDMKGSKKWWLKCIPQDLLIIVLWLCGQMINFAYCVQEPKMPRVENE